MTSWMIRDESINYHKNNDQINGKRVLVFMKLKIKNVYIHKIYTIHKYYNVYVHIISLS